MSKAQWVKHYERRLAEAEERFAGCSPEMRELWAAEIADRDTADEEANAVDAATDAAKDRGIT